MIHLDTSFLIRGFVSGTPENRVLRGWLGADETLAVSTVAWMEFLCGPVEPREMEFATSIVNRHIDFKPAHAEIAARLFNLSGRRRRLFVDCAIAATAIAEDAPIATTNERDFSRFESEGLTLAHT